MAKFVEFQWIGNAFTIAINPEHVVQAKQFDSGRGIGTTLTLVHGEANVSGTLAETLEKLRAAQ